mgnify:CR=1 FL=1
MDTKPEWLEDASLQQFFAATRAVGGEARAVGGCVRDQLLGIEGADVGIFVDGDYSRSGNRFESLRISGNIIGSDIDSLSVRNRGIWLSGTNSCVVENNTIIQPSPLFAIDTSKSGPLA